ncbi:MAG: hydrogenase maturation factor [Butyrivibrio sp.]|nr:hydrogenase maturation factor [Butyrivibrio sp.]
MRIGKITENALKRSVLKQIKTEFKGKTSAAVGTDCAFSDEKKTFVTICPLTVSLKEAGFYSVVKAVNGIVSQGLRAEQISLSILLPKDADEPVIKKIVADAIEAAKKCGVVYSGGHTEVTTAVTRPVVTATCIGVMREDEAAKALLTGKPKAGQELVITKWVALEGTAMLAAEKFSELTGKYPVPFIDNAREFKDYLDVAQEMEIAMKTGVSACHDLSNGGVFAGLWEFGSRAGTGLKVDLKKIPLRQETVEICEFFEINPYQLLSGGALLMATDNGEKLVSALEEEGIPAAIIGTLEEGKDRILINGDETRFLDLPQADEIHKVLG